LTTQDVHSGFPPIPVVPVAVALVLRPPVVPSPKVLTFPVFPVAAKPEVPKFDVVEVSVENVWSPLVPVVAMLLVATVPVFRVPEAPMEPEAPVVLAVVGGRGSMMLELAQPAMTQTQRASSEDRRPGMGPHVTSPRRIIHPDAPIRAPGQHPIALRCARYP
jgi:hypothetical protein